LKESLVIRTLAPYDWPLYRAIRLRSLADSPDAFATTLGEQQAHAPETWAARLSAASISGKDYPLVAEWDGTPAGLVWAKVDGEDSTAVNIFQMWVAPEVRGRGIAAALLREAVNWARSKNARAVQLGVTCGNSSAVRLYEREGFKNVGQPQPRGQDSPLFEQAMRLALQPTDA
jgi:ribosomal protein S18 acetylase RimI-like enzyme